METCGLKPAAQHGTVELRCKGMHGTCIFWCLPITVSLLLSPSFKHEDLNPTRFEVQSGAAIGATCELFWLSFDKVKHSAGSPPGPAHIIPFAMKPFRMLYVLCFLVPSTLAMKTATWLYLLQYPVLRVELLLVSCASKQGFLPIHPDRRCQAGDGAHPLEKRGAELCRVLSAFRFVPGLPVLPRSTTFKKIKACRTRRRIRNRRRAWRAWVTSAGTWSS